MLDKPHMVTAIKILVWNKPSIGRQFGQPTARPRVRLASQVTGEWSFELGESDKKDATPSERDRPNKEREIEEKGLLKFLFRAGKVSFSDIDRTDYHPN